MDNGEKKISSLFDGRTIFNIPEYQRAYAWEDSHLSDFVEDIQNQKVDRNYFLGTILFQEKGSKNYYEMIDIVDGQQRITTIIIFMSILIQRLKKEASAGESTGIDLLYETYVKHGDQFKLRVLDEDNDYFRSYILSEDNNGQDYTTTPAQRKLCNAKEFFVKFFSKLNKAELNSIRKKVDENSRVLVYSVKDTAEATLIFETTNDRGKGLTNLEKIKSFMMYKSYVASEEKPNQLLNTLDTIRTRFSDIYKEYERYAVQLGEDPILQYHFIGHQEWSGKEYRQYVVEVKKAVNKLIANKDYSATIKFINKYTRELKETFMAVREILNSKISDLRNIFILSHAGNFWPLLIKAFKLDDSKDKPKFSRIVHLLEIYSFRVYAVNRNRNHAGQSRLYSYARDFSGNFPSLETSLAETISYYSSDDGFKANLSDPYIYERMHHRDLSYLFWKYENHLRTSEQPIASPMSEDEFLTDDPKYKFSIEHIASQNPRKSIVEDESILPEISEEFKKKYLHSIGNLTIDPQSANSSKGNKEFADKNEKYFIRAPFKTQNKLEDYLKDHMGGKVWSSVSIAERSDDIIAFALSHWSAKKPKK